MYCRRNKFLARLQVMVAYRRLGNFVWNSQSRYAFRCVDEEAVLSVIRESPAPLERL